MLSACIFHFIYALFHRLGLGLEIAEVLLKLPQDLFLSGLADWIVMTAAAAPVVVSCTPMRVIV